MTAQEQDVQAALNAAIQHARNGDKQHARALLLQIVERNPAQEEVWLWLAGLAEDLEEAQTYLETVLALNPHHQQAQRGLALVKQRLAQVQAQPSVTSEPEAPHGVILCPNCGHPKPQDAAICPNCGYLEGKPAVEEVSDLHPIPAHPTPSNVNHEIAPSFTLSIDQAEAIDACLERMAYESEARSIILADVTGQLISERGKTTGINTQVLSALAAGELSATQEMARLVGEKARFNLLLHEGEEHSVYLSPVGNKMLLIIVFDERTPIGLVRIILKNAVEELGPILERPTRPADARDVKGALKGDFAQQLENELDASLDFMIE